MTLEDSYGYLSIVNVVIFRNHWSIHASNCIAARNSISTLAENEQILFSVFFLFISLTLMFYLTQSSV